MTGLINTKQPGLSFPTNTAERVITQQGVQQETVRGIHPRNMLRKSLLLVTGAVVLITGMALATPALSEQTANANFTFEQAPLLQAQNYPYCNLPEFFVIPDGGSIAKGVTAILDERNFPSDPALRKAAIMEVVAQNPAFGNGNHVIPGDKILITDELKVCDIFGANTSAPQLPETTPAAEDSPSVTFTILDPGPTATPEKQPEAPQIEVPAAPPAEQAVEQNFNAIEATPTQTSIPQKQPSAEQVYQGQKPLTTEEIITRLAPLGIVIGLTLIAGLTFLIKKYPHSFVEMLRTYGPLPNKKVPPMTKRPGLTPQTRQSYNRAEAERSQSRYQNHPANDHFQDGDRDTPRSLPTGNFRIRNINNRRPPG